MKEIPLTQDQIALVDDEDYEYLNQWKWSAYYARNTFYAARNITTPKGNRTTIKMARVILNAQKDEEVDHKDHNGLNNQRDNIRLTNRSGNGCNRKKRRNNTSGFKGVTLIRGRSPRPYKAQIMLDGKQRHIGMYSTVEEAAQAYDEAARELHGEFACLNFP